jgi:hypothetical protein
VRGDDPAGFIERCAWAAPLNFDPNIDVPPTLPTRGCRFGHLASTNNYLARDINSQT